MITIGYTYYDNYEMFENVRDYYAALDNPNIKMLWVDDGSPNRPLTAEDMPEGWQLYRITKDVGWNNEGAKNLIMKVAETEWVILLDIDHVLFADVYRGIHQIEDKLPYNAAPFFRRVLNIEQTDRPRPGWVKPNVDPIRQFSANSYAITKTYFWELGGYDESHQGMYGYDGTMVKRLRPNNAGSLHVGMDGFTLGGGGSSWTREEKDTNKHSWKGGKKRFKPTKERCRFPWKRIS